MGKTLSLSADRGQFQLKRYLDTLKKDPGNTNALQMVEYYTDWSDKERVRMQNPEWQKDNLEYDLLTTDWILEKVRASESYAQNLYAAICNNDFQRNDVWPILIEQRWSCSWRHAGGIVADMRQEGDYIDWYCSGIHNEVSDEEFQAMNKESQERYLYMKNNFVSESNVTEEIEDDLLKLGWLVIKDNE